MIQVLRMKCLSLLQKSIHKLFLVYNDMDLLVILETKMRSKKF